MPPGFDANVAYVLAVLTAVAYNRHQGGPLNLPKGFAQSGEVFYQDGYGSSVSIGLLLVSSKTVVLAFRGTVDSGEFWIDFDWSLTDSAWTPNYWLVHHGFDGLYGQIRGSIIA